MSDKTHCSAHLRYKPYETCCVAAPQAVARRHQLLRADTIVPQVQFHSCLLVSHSIYDLSNLAKKITRFHRLLLHLDFDFSIDFGYQDCHSSACAKRNRDRLRPDAYVEVTSSIPNLVVSDITSPHNCATAQFTAEFNISSSMCVTEFHQLGNIVGMLEDIFRFVRYQYPM